MTPSALELPRESDAEPSALIAGRYRVESMLGRGAAGAVLAVFDTATCRRVALKQLVAGASERLHALFEQEYYTLAALSHPGIVQAFDYGSDADRPYYTMELLSGTDLTARVPYALDDACHVLGELAAALSVLHARRLVHRDISPRNVWRQPDGRIKLIDFGALAPFGSPRDVVGTPPLVAPEALAGQLLDQRTDLYSLGALLYWMLSGVHAFPAHGLKELHALWSRGFTPLHRALSARGAAPIPSAVEALIESLLSRDPLARPGHTAELIDRLRATAGVPLTVAVTRQAGLPSSVLVGRDRERTQFQKTLAQNQAGLARPMLFEGEAGSGRSRLLRELGLSARLGGSCALYVEAGRCEGAFGVARTLLERALDAAPEQARAAALPHASTLALLSPLVSARLSAHPVRLPSAAGEARARMHEALRSCLLALSEKTPVVILVDDVERADEASQALLLSLAQPGESARVLCVASLLRASARERTPALRALCASMRRFSLRPL
ncbi:MAG TPA: serine/threonine-protein kinase, partial [Polyangiales bacterium]